MQTQCPCHGWLLWEEGCDPAHWEEPGPVEAWLQGGRLCAHLEIAPSSGPGLQTHPCLPLGQVPDPLLEEGQEGRCAWDGQARPLARSFIGQTLCEPLFRAVRVWFWEPSNDRGRHCPCPLEGWPVEVECQVVINAPWRARARSQAKGAGRSQHTVSAKPLLHPQGFVWF